MYHGNGGYDWETVYNMPIWLRKFTFKKIQEYFDKQQDEIDKHKKSLQNSQNPQPKISRLNIKPDYISKAPKK